MKKFLFFTQFADTANYIHNHLKCGDKKQIACATGDSDNPTALAQRFSPVSNGLKPSKNELRVLISTDVLSEGQNLQDAHIIVNYDLPWAIIRLIQRAGRVDRIGQSLRKFFVILSSLKTGLKKSSGSEKDSKAELKKMLKLLALMKYFLMVILSILLTCTMKNPVFLMRTKLTPKLTSLLMLFKSGKMQQMKTLNSKKLYPIFQMLYMQQRKTT
jgi:ERCC4-related helicase